MPSERRVDEAVTRLAGAGIRTMSFVLAEIATARGLSNVGVEPVWGSAPQAWLVTFELPGGPGGRWRPYDLHRFTVQDAGQLRAQIAEWQANEAERMLLGRDL